MKLLVNIDVPDLDRAVAFYCDGLGLQLSRIIDEDVAELRGASCLVYLLKKSPDTKVASTLDSGRHYSRHWTPVHLDFVVDDLENAARRVIAAGGKQESGCVLWMGSKCITFSDPFGHGFCLIQFTGEGYAAI